MAAKFHKSNMATAVERFPFPLNFSAKHQIYSLCMNFLGSLHFVPPRANLSDQNRGQGMRQEWIKGDEPTFFCCFSHAGSSNPSLSHSSSSSIYPSLYWSMVVLAPSLFCPTGKSKWSNCCLQDGNSPSKKFTWGFSVPPRQRSQSRDNFRISKYSFGTPREGIRPSKQSGQLSLHFVFCTWFGYVSPENMHRHENLFQDTVCQT